jgi:hypothetical protein
VGENFNIYGNDRVWCQSCQGSRVDGGDQNCTRTHLEDPDYAYAQRSATGSKLHQHMRIKMDA